MATKIQLRRDSSTNWTSNNPVLASGEIGLELDTDKFKIGDGTTGWTSLSYAYIQADNNYIDADKTKVGYISVTQAVNLDTMESNIADHETRIDVLENNLNIIDTSGSPGNDTLIQGDETDGLFGFVPASEFIDGDTLASDLAFTAGTSYKPNSPWAKVMIGGELGFFPILPLRYSVAWDSIYYVGAVYGDGTIGTLPPEGRLGTELEITGADTITTTGHFLGGKSSANDYYDDVGADGDTIVLAGWDNAGNNGEFTIDTITDSTITIVEGGLTAEVGDRDSKLYPKANEVLQDAEVTIDGLVYKVRLFKGFDEDPMNSYVDGDRGAVGVGSEWNRIVLPLHERAEAQNWNYTAYAGTTEDWKTKLSDEDMILHNSFGSGSYRWVQEARNDTQTFRRGFRGANGASYAGATYSWITYSYLGWCPVLILKNS